MELIEFKEQTTVIAKDQPPYIALPAHRFKDDKNACCWKLSWRDRWKILWTGHEILTFNNALQPQRLSVDKPAMLNEEVV